MVIFEVWAYLAALLNPFLYLAGVRVQGRRKFQPPQYDLPDPRGRQENIEYFEDSAEASLNCRNLSLT